MQPPTRSLSAIASDIRSAWPNMKFLAPAGPYLRAMAELGSIDDDFGYDSAKSIVRYFLANANTWRGPEARRLKAELKGMLS